MNKTALRIEDSHAGPVCVVSISGRIDSGNAAQLLERLNKLISSGEKTILLDFKEVLYLTSAAFRALLVATDEAERNAGRLALCSVIWARPRAVRDGGAARCIHDPGLARRGSGASSGDGHVARRPTRPPELIYSVDETPPPVVLALRRCSRWL